LSGWLIEWNETLPKLKAKGFEMAPFIASEIYDKNTDRHFLIVADRELNRSELLFVVANSKPDWVYERTDGVALFVITLQLGWEIPAKNSGE
jgi:hypothetical protein